MLRHSIVALALVAAPSIARAQDAGADLAPSGALPPVEKRPIRLAYPAALLGSGREATVTVMADIDEEGHVTRALVTVSGGTPFDEAALAAVRDLEYSPAQIDGRPSAARLQYVLRFRAPVIAPPADAGAADGAPVAPPGSLPPPPRVTPDRVLVRGWIRERGTRAPVVGAEVVLTASDAQGALAPSGAVVAETDLGGRFEVRGAGDRGFRLTVVEPNHQPCLRDFAPAAGARPVEWSCLASTREGPSYETIVAAPGPGPEQPRHAVTQAEARTVPGTMGDPLRAVQSLPGVARAPFGMGLLVVRGASPADSGVFLDGVQLPALYHFLVGPSVLTAHLIDQIDFYPGGFGVQYGRISAGAIGVTARTAGATRLQGAAEASPLDASLFFEGPVGQGTSIAAGARRSTIDFILPKLVPEKPGSTFTTAVPSYWDYQARADHALEKGRLSLFVFGSHDDLNIVAADPNRRLEIGNHVTFHRALVTWTRALGRWTSRFRPAYGYGEERFNAARDGGRIWNHRFYLREDLTRDFGPRFALALGFDGLLSGDWADFDFAFPREGRTYGTTKPERVVTRRSYLDVAPAEFVEARWSVTRALRLVPGVRFDQYFVLDQVRQSIDPRLGLHWAVTERFGLRAGAGLFHQLPVPRYLDNEFGNPKLKLVRAEQYHLGFDHQLTDALRISATAFAVWRRNIPVPSAERFSSLGRSRARGLELIVRHALARHFYGWLAYTLSRTEQSAIFAEEIEAGLASPRGSSEGETARTGWRPSTFHQTHNLVVVASYHRGAWEVGARYRLVSGRPATPIADRISDLDFAVHTPELGGLASARRPLFSQLDLRVERTFTFDYWRLGIFLDLQNALNAANPEDTIYNYRYDQSAPVRGLPILPLLGARGSF
jgi:TonB family protein